MKKQTIPMHKIKKPKKPLVEMFLRQEQFQVKLGIRAHAKVGEIITPEILMRIKETLLCIHQETSEALEWIPGWKSWSKKKGKLTKRQRWEYLNELVDIQHFLINAAIHVGCTGEEFTYMFFNKQHENALRQKRGY